MIRKYVFIVPVLLDALLLNSYAFASSDKYLLAGEIQTVLKSTNQPTLLRGNFEQTKFIKDLDVTITTSGTYEIFKDSNENFKIIWKIKVPEPMIICIDNTKFVIENNLTKKKNILKLEELSLKDSSGMSRLIHLIRLDPNYISNHFNIKKHKEDLLISPIQLDQFTFLNAIVNLDKSKNIEKITLNEKSGDRIEIKFLKTVESKSSNKIDLVSKSCN